MSALRWSTLAAMTLVPPLVLSFCWTFGTAHALQICDSALRNAREQTDRAIAWKAKPFASRLCFSSAGLYLLVCPVWVGMVAFGISFDVCHYWWYFEAYESSQGCSHSANFHAWMFFSMALHLGCVASVAFVLMQYAYVPGFICQDYGVWESFSRGWSVARAGWWWRVKLFVLAQLLPSWAVLAAITPCVSFTQRVLDMHGKFSPMLIVGILITIILIAAPTFFVTSFALVPNAIAFRAAASNCLGTNAAASIQLGDHDDADESLETEELLGSL